jgi:hypothetical protein
MIDAPPLLGTLVDVVLVRVAMKPPEVTVAAMLTGVLPSRVRRAQRRRGALPPRADKRSMKLAPKTVLFDTRSALQ